MHLNNLGWWLIILLNFVGYFILSFGSISNGTLKEAEKAIGMLITTLSFILMLIFFGFVSSIALMLILWIVITPIVMVLITQLEKKLFPYRIKVREKYARKLNVTEEEVGRINQMNDTEFDEEMHKKYEWLNINNTKDKIYDRQQPLPFNPNEFPTLVKYDSQKIEDAIQKLMKDRSMTRQQALVNLEQDLSEIESR